MRRIDDEEEVEPSGDQRSRRRIDVEDEKDEVGKSPADDTNRGRGRGKGKRFAPEVKDGERRRTSSPPRGKKAFRRKSTNGDVEIDASGSNTNAANPIEYFLACAVLNDDIQEKAVELHPREDKKREKSDPSQGMFIDKAKSRRHAEEIREDFRGVVPGIGFDSNPRPYGKTLIVDNVANIPPVSSRRRDGADAEDTIEIQILKKTLESVSRNNAQAEKDADLLQKNNVQIKTFKHVTSTQQNGIIQKIKERLLENVDLSLASSTQEERRKIEGEETNYEGVSNKAFPISVPDNIKKTEKDHWEGIMASFHLQTDGYLASRAGQAANGQPSSIAGGASSSSDSQQGNKKKNTEKKKENRSKSDGVGGLGAKYDQNMCPKIPCLEREYCCQFLRGPVEEIGERPCFFGNMCQSYILSKELLQNTLSVSKDKTKCPLTTPFCLREFLLPDEMKARMQALLENPKRDPKEVINASFEDVKSCLLCHRWIVHRNALVRANNGGNNKGIYIMQNHGNSFGCEGGYRQEARLNAGQSFVGIVVPVMRFGKTDYLYAPHNVFYKQSRSDPSVIQKTSRESNARESIPSKVARGESGMTEDEMEMGDDEFDVVEADMFRNPESVISYEKGKGKREGEDRHPVITVEVDGFVENPKIIFRNASDQKGLNVANSMADRLRYKNLS